MGQQIKTLFIYVKKKVAELLRNCLVVYCDLVASLSVVERVSCVGRHDRYTDEPLPTKGFNYVSRLK